MVRQQDLFVSGVGGYKTYRIPALVVSTQGTVLAFCEGRKDGVADSGDIDILLRRSFDQGRTWEGPRVVVAGAGDTAGNPAPVVDRRTGTIFLLFCRNNSDGPEPLILTGEAPRTVWLTKSEDDGATWSEPVELTSSVKRLGWTWYATGPGHGLQLKSGRLLIPCDHAVGPESAPVQSPYFSHVIYSDDAGATWEIGGVIGPGTNECTLVELEDVAYINCRGMLEGHRERAYAYSYDEGVTFTPVAWDQVLTEPQCKASLLKVTLREKPYVLFSNPASTRREKLTIKISKDDCRSWEPGILIYPGPSAYSDLCSLDDGPILCFYERGHQNPYEFLTLATIDTEELLG